MLLPHADRAGSADGRVISRHSFSCRLMMPETKAPRFAALALAGDEFIRRVPIHVLAKEPLPHPLTPASQHVERRRPNNLHVRVRVGSRAAFRTR